MDLFVNLRRVIGASIPGMVRKSSSKSARSRKKLRERIASHKSEEVVEVKVPSDFRLRDYVLGEFLFMSLGFDIHMLQGKWWGKFNSIEDLLLEFKLNREKSSSHDVAKGDFGENTYDEIKLREQLVEKKDNLNSFRFKHYHYHKIKHSVQKECPSIARDIVTQKKKRLDNTRCSWQAKTSMFCLKDSSLC